MSAPVITSNLLTARFLREGDVFTASGATVDGEPCGDYEKFVVGGEPIIDNGTVYVLVDYGDDEAGCVEIPAHWMVTVYLDLPDCA